MKLKAKPAFGIPTVHFNNKIQMDPKRDISEHTNALWGMVAKNIVVEGAMEGSKPRLVQLLETFNELNDKHYKQEFALAHNIRLNNRGEPDPKLYNLAQKASKGMQQRVQTEQKESNRRLKQEEQQLLINSIITLQSRVDPLKNKSKNKRQARE